MSQFKPYPAYKDSGVEWLGEIPEYWSASGLKRVFQIEGGSTPPPDEANWEGDITWVTPADLSGLKSLFIGGSKRTITATGLASCGASILPKGSLILSTRAPIGSLAIATIKMCTNQGCKGLLPNESTSSHYFAYVLSVAKEELNNRGRGTTFLEISGDELGRFNVPMPSFSEQTQIANFLDHETVRIDGLIEEQKRLIELLKEKRQAVISNAVTKGLDASVPMKDSGVEWLGEVPAHWNVVRLKNISRIVDCKNRTPEYFDDGEYLVVRTTNIKKQQLSLNGARYTDIKNFKIWTERGVPPVGSIFFTREAPSGEVCIVPKAPPLCMGQRMMNIIPNDSQLTPFIFDFLTSDCLTKYIESEASGSTVTHLRVEQVFNIPLVIPPKNERDDIDKLVKTLKHQYDSLIEQSKASVEFLNERRSALISAAVTGKIDVRNWQAPTVAPQAQAEKA